MIPAAGVNETFTWTNLDYFRNINFIMQLIDTKNVNPIQKALIISLRKITIDSFGLDSFD